MVFAGLSPSLTERRATWCSTAETSWKRSLLTPRTASARSSTLRAVRTRDGRVASSPGVSSRIALLVLAPALYITSCKVFCSTPCAFYHIATPRLHALHVTAAVVSNPKPRSLEPAPNVPDGLHVTDLAHYACTPLKIDADSFDNRSDNCGPEPEGLAKTSIGGRFVPKAFRVSALICGLGMYNTAPGYGVILFTSESLRCSPEATRADACVCRFRRGAWGGARTDERTRLHNPSNLRPHSPGRCGAKAAHPNELRHVLVATFFSGCLAGLSSSLVWRGSVDGWPLM